MTHKYHAQPTEVDGEKFPSKGEAGRWQELKLLEAAGAIKGLKRQIPFPLVVNGVKIGSYIADFEYDEGGERVVEDYKGVRTPVYNLKKKLVRALYGIEIFETGR